jgi:glucosamine-phosphate N-acetyltransferase
MNTDSHLQYHVLSLLEFIEKYKNQMTIVEIKDQYLLLLSFLTIVEPMTEEKFVEKIHDICTHNGNIIVCYCETNETHKPTLVGSGTIFIEPKLIRGRQSVGHIEDIVVHSNHRGLGISNNLLHVLVEIARVNYCYKLILDCDPAVKKVYEKAGFQEKGIQMAYYFST